MECGTPFSVKPAMTSILTLNIHWFSAPPQINWWGVIKVKLPKCLASKNDNVVFDLHLNLLQFLFPLLVSSLMGERMIANYWIMFLLPLFSFFPVLSLLPFFASFHSFIFLFVRPSVCRSFILFLFICLVLSCSLVFELFSLANPFPLKLNPPPHPPNI